MVTTCVSVSAPAPYYLSESPANVCPGPRELSIANPEAVKAIYGTQSPTTKGPWYTLLEPRVPVFMARDKQEHARRRKVWDQGFTTKGKNLNSIAFSTVC